MSTIVIPYKDDILSGTELLFALRSIDRYLTGWTNVVIIGTPPDWYKGESVQAPDYRYRKQFSIYSKLLIACELNNVTDNFIMWNDDHYLLRPLDVSEFKNWYDGYLKETINKNHGIRYRETIANTLQLIPDAFNYDIHTPCIYNKRLFKFLFSDRTDEVCIKSFYFDYARNIAMNINGYVCDYEMKDLKINQLTSEDAIYRLILERYFFSTSTNGMKKPMIKAMNELYPNPSRYER